MAETAVNFLMENLKLLMNCKIQLILDEKDQIDRLYNELAFLRSFLKDWGEKCYEHEKLKNLVTLIRYAVCKAEDTIDLFVVDAVMRYSGMAEKIGFGCVPNPSLKLGDVQEVIKAIQRELMEIYDIGDLEVGESSNGASSSRANIPMGEEDRIVGFEDEAITIKGRLIGGQSQLEVISIIGMAGQGKTTLARKVYYDSLTIYHFYIRAWISVSQKYQMRDLLLEILSSVFQHTDEIYKMSEEKLGGQLYKRLKGKRYLIVIDDIWDIRLWNEFKRFFPNDNNGSRIMITSRLKDVALRAKPNSCPHFLHFLIEDESWDLFRQKVFRGETCPPELTETGKQIAKKCQGLPLAIVVVAGILAKEEKRQDWWKLVAESLSSHVVGDPQQCMDTLALSYNHLPHHLKPCFLYFGAFPEDFEIPVQKLIWLWVAEGFIQRVGQKSVEDTAEEYLMDLIDRSLVLISKRRSDGGIKACRIHDLLHDFCLRKAKEEYFLQQLSGQQHAASSPMRFAIDFNELPQEKMQFRYLARNQHSMLFGMSSVHPIANIRRLCVHADVLHRICLFPSALNIRSFLCLASRCTQLPYGPTQFGYRPFKLLRVLDISSIPIHLYPNDIEQLVLLRYLALCVSFDSLPASIANLWNLETLILSMLFEFVILPDSVWKMEKLRHLCVSGGGLYKIGRQHSFEAEARDGGYPSSLDSLQTISRLYPRSCQDFLAGTPNLRALAFEGSMISDSCLTFLDLDHLNHLQKLKLFNTARPSNIDSLIKLQSVKFPPNLRKLTLEKTHLNWNEMSTLGMLPNLEILKLYSDAFVGSYWEARDGEFGRLKYLKFQSLDIESWNASSNHFPKLEQLELVGLRFLAKLPAALVDIPTLQIIEVRSCGYFAQLSATQIREDQEIMGKNWLKIIDHQYED